MKVGDKIQILKFFSGIFNSVFLILGVSIFGCAVWILFDTGSFVAVLSSVEVKTIAGGLFVIGLVVVGVTVLGCAGGHLENRCLLVMYMSFLIPIVLGQVFITFILLLNHGKISDALDTKVDDIIRDYGDNSLDLKWKLLDNVQHYGQCCGKQEPSDWRNNSFISSLVNRSKVFPCSCFNSSSCPVLSSDARLFGLGTHVYAEGCEEKIHVWFRENVLTILGMDLSLLLIQVLQFVVAVYLFQNVGKKDRKIHVSQLINSEEVPEATNDYPETNLVHPTTNHGYTPNHIQPMQNYAQNQFMLQG